MSLFRNFATGLRSLFRKNQVDRELDEELGAYLEMEAAEKMRQGVSRKDALREVRLERGSLEITKELVRSGGWEFFVETCWQDLRFGLRMLRKNPGFTAVAILTLALGIGANTTIFSIVNGLLLRKPPVRDADSVMVVSTKYEAEARTPDRFPVSAPDFLDWCEQASVFSRMAAANFDDYTISDGTIPERVTGGRVSANFFQALGVGAAIGRTILPGEEQFGHHYVVVLSDELWRKKFDRDPRVLGRVMRINGNPYAIIGVMPGSFRLWDFDAEIWMPLAFSREEIAPTGRSSRFLRVFGRLKPSFGQKQAASEMETIARRIAGTHPDTNKGWGTTVMSLQQFGIADANATTAVMFLMAAVSFVLLIACANLANLLLGRNSARRREFSVRAALGAGRNRIARQLVTECLLVSLAGGSLGVLLAFWGLDALRSQFNWNQDAVAMAKEFSIDMRVLLFTIAISFMAAILFGLAPALQILRRSPGEGLKEDSRNFTGGRERHRLQRLLVIGQIAMSLILLAGASLFIEGFLEEMRANAGFNSRNLLTASVYLRGLEYYGAPQREAAFFENVLRNLKSSSEVESTAGASDLPFNFPSWKSFTIEGHPVSRPDERPSSGYFVVSPGYFKVLQLPVLQGREFTPSDNADSAPVVIVDRAFAKKYFGNEYPIGRHINTSNENPTPDKGGAWNVCPWATCGSVRWSEIVGVIADVTEFVGQREPRPHFYEPFLAHPTGSMNFVVRTHRDAAGFSDSLRRAALAADPNQAIASVRTMDRLIADSSSGDDLMSELMGAFAGIALLTAAIGIYGVLSYMVGQRVHEMGIRMALGAEPSQVLGLVIRRGMAMSGIGVVLGLAVSLALPRLFAATFDNFHAHSAVAVGIALLVVGGAAFLACWFPARRAMRVDPMTALRYE
jgi:putative ABC transport system permease protein